MSTPRFFILDGFQHRKEFTSSALLSIYLYHQQKGQIYPVGMEDLIVNFDCGVPPTVSFQEKKPSAINTNYNSSAFQSHINTVLEAIRFGQLHISKWDLLMQLKNLNDPEINKVINSNHFNKGKIKNLERALETLQQIKQLLEDKIQTQQEPQRFFYTKPLTHTQKKVYRVLNAVDLSKINTKKDVEKIMAPLAPLVPLQSQIKSKL